MPDFVTTGFTQLTNASVRSPRLGQLLHLCWRQDCASAPNISISIDRTLIPSQHHVLDLVLPVQPAFEGSDGQTRGERRRWRRIWCARKRLSDRGRERRGHRG